ncbi:hypothetical protein JCM17823_25140 [Halorubrum gandharaense]
MADDSMGIGGRLRQVFFTGVAVIVPLLISLIVLAFAFNFIYDYLDLFSDQILPFSPEVTAPVIGTIEQEVLVELATPLVLLTLILLVGLVATSSRYGELAVDYFDYVIEQIPGFGSVYEGFRQMSDVMLESDSQNFQEVVLVEFPTEGVYAVAFVTSETPDSVADPVGKGDMRTLFMPMAPNPVMGGHVVFVPEERIVEVDMTVEEGIRALVTSGVAIGNADGGHGGLTASDLQELSMVERIEQRFDPASASGDVHREEQGASDRAEKYDARVDPEKARTPGSIVNRERDAADASDADVTSDPDHPDSGVDAAARTTPAERAGRYAAEREHTAARPSEQAGAGHSEQTDRDDHDDTTIPPAERAGRGNREDADDRGDRNDRNDQADDDRTDES